MINVLVTAKRSQLAQCIESLVRKHENINFIFKSSSELDITNKHQVDSVFKNISKLDYCINCAAYTAVDKAETETEQAYNVNVTGVKNLAEACLAQKIVLIHISTDFVFDGTKTSPYLETDKTNPISVYGQTKEKGEQALMDRLDSYFIIRTSWLYSEYGNNFLKTMLRLAGERDEISIVGDQIGSPTYATDLAEAILKIIASKSENFGLYHYSNKGVVSWYDFANEIFRLSNSTVKLNKIETKDYPTPALRPKFSVLNTSKIENTLGIADSDWKASLATAFSNLENEY